MSTSKIVNLRRYTITGGGEAISTAGGQYTCPSDGYIIGNIQSVNAATSAYISVNDIEMFGVISTSAFPALVFVRKGDVVKTRNQGTYLLRFIPLGG